MSHPEFWQQKERSIQIYVETHIEKVGGGGMAHVID